MTVRATLVCQWYPPEPAAVPESIATSLQAEGLDVQVLTGVPNYPTGVVHEGYSAARTSHEVMRGVRVHRAPLFPSHDANAAKRVANYASWAISSTLLGQGPLRRSDVSLVYSSPATAALPAMAAKALWGTPYVLLIQDVWPDSIFSSGFLNGRLVRAVRAAVDVFVRRAYRGAAHIAVISPGMVDLLVSRGVPRESLSVVYNWLPGGREAGATTTVSGLSLRERLGIPESSRTFLYAGNHGRAQMLEPLVDAFKRPTTSPANLVLLGDGVTKKSLVARAAGAPRVHFLDPVDYAEAERLSSSADVHVVSLADEPLFAATMPSKTQAALASGAPILAVAPGDTAEVVTSSRAGIAARPGDVSSIVKAVVAFNHLTGDALDEMGLRGRDAYERLMGREIGAAHLADLLKGAAARPKRPHDQASRMSTATVARVGNEGNEEEKL